MIDFFNIKKGGGSGGGDRSTLNVFTQLDEPTVKKGIWLKANKQMEHVTCDEDVFVGGEWLADGMKANIPYEFYAGAAVAIGTDIYLFGSDWTNSYRVYNYKYNTLTDTYTKMTDIPYGFNYGSAVAVGTDIYLFGSYDSATTAYKYNTLTDTYTQLTDIPYYHYKGSAVAIGTDIYLLGGDYDSATKKTAYKYDTLTDTYTQLTNIPYEFDQGSAVAIGTDIYLLGGYTIYKNYKYDTLTDTYTQLTNIPYNLYQGSAVAVGTDIYILGGNGYKQNNYKYNTLTNTYTQLTNIPYNYCLGSAVLMGTEIYLFGGSGGGNSKKVQVYNLTSKTYQQDELVVISQGKYNDVGYEIELFSNNKMATQPKYAFADAWYYTIQGGLETDIPTYYGNGTEWVNIKNPPINNIEEGEI